MNKKLLLHEHDNHTEQLKLSQNKTDVIIKVHGTDKVLFRGSNKVLIPGSAYTAMKHFKIKPSVTLPSYNDALGLDGRQALTVEQEYNSLVYLFAVGTSGCGPENSQVYDVEYTKWIDPNDLVPFRYVYENNDLSADLRNKYFGRKQISGTDRVAYYFKAFEKDPVFKQQYVDGTPIDSNVYYSDNPSDAESFIELKMEVSPEDCKEYFQATTGLNTARINTISLLTAYPVSMNGYTYYQGIRPLTRLNFPNKPLIDIDDGIDITYLIYY